MYALNRWAIFSVVAVIVFKKKKQSPPPSKMLDNSRQGVPVEAVETTSMSPSIRGGLNYY